MKVVFSGLVSHMTGSFAGASIRKYKQGFSMYPKVVEVKRNTTNQSITRARYARICSAWNALLPAEVNEWNARRISAGYIDISTFNFYILVQTPQLACFDSVVSTSDYVVDKSLIVSSVIEDLSTVVELDVEAEAVNVQGCLEVYAGVISNGISSVFFDRLPIFERLYSNTTNFFKQYSINNSFFRSGNRYAVRVVFVNNCALKSEPVDYILQL